MALDRSRWPIVAGGAISRFGRSKDGSNWRDRVRDVARLAVADAGLGLHDIDALVVATESDFVSLQVNPAAVVASELGLTSVPAMRVEGGGASGALSVRAATLHIVSGLHDRVLVIGFDDAASHLDKAGVGLVYGLSFDAEVEGFAGATAASLYALSALAYMARSGATEGDLAAVAVKNRSHAQRNPNAHLPMSSTVADVLASPIVSTPLKRLDCSPLSDGAAALMLCAPDAAPLQDRHRVRVVGTGCATDWARLGDRPEPGRFQGKKAAATIAYRHAGVTAPAREIDVAEVYDAFTSAELQGLEALGLAPDGDVVSAARAGRFDSGGALPVNLSGGLLGQGGSPGAVGVAQVVSIARLLEGRYHAGLQPDRELWRGLADAHGGIATLNCVHVLERER